MLWFFTESLLTLPLLYAIMTTIIEFRFGRLWCFTVMCLAVCATFVMDCCLYLYGVNTVELYSYAWITTCVPSFLSLLYLAKYRDGSFLFAYLTECILASIITSIAHILAFLVPQQNEVIPVLFHMALLLLALLVCRRLFKERFFEAARTQGKRWILYCVMPVLCLIVWLMFTGSAVRALDTDNMVSLPYAGYVYPQDIPMIIVLLTFIVYIVALILINITSTYQADTERREKAALDFEIRALQERLSGLEQKDQSLRILRHDMRHHIRTLSVLLEHKENVSEAQEYLSQLDSNLIKTKQERYCCNTAISAILSFYAAKAQREKIEFSVQVQIPDELPVDDMDIGAVISNTLENAFWACMKLPQEEERFIHIKLIQHKRQFVLDISNSFSGTVEFDSGGRPVSKKKDHGIGTQSICAFARKYDGITDYSAKDGIFNIRMMFVGAGMDLE